jgi:Transposase DDE domain
VHAGLIQRTHGERLVGHISRDATAISARERVDKKNAAAASKTASQPTPKRKRGEPKPPEKMTRIERQQTMKLEDMLADLPRQCAVGCKTNSHGRKETWRGYKLHLDVADGQIPISALLTSASLHDSQAAMPLATITALRVTNLYDLMDSAYDCAALRKHSEALQHIPIIERVHRGQGLIPMAPHEAARYRERTSVERVNSRLKDEFGGRNVRVRGHAKVMAHVMFGLLALTVDQILRLAT